MFRRALPLFLAGLFAACHMDPSPESPSDMATRRIGKIDWYLDYDAALEVARRADKPLWVHFGEDPG